MLAKQGVINYCDSASYWKSQPGQLSKEKKLKASKLERKK